MRTQNQQHTSTGNSKKNVTVSQVGDYLVHPKAVIKDAYGTTYVAEDTTKNKKLYFAKVLEKAHLDSNSNLRVGFNSDVYVMNKLTHPNLLRLYDLVQTATHYYQISQFFNGGNIGQIVEKRGKLTEPEAVFYLKQLMTALVELHLNGIILKGFKITSLFLNNGNVVMTDFSGSMVDPKKGVNRGNSTPPEILFNYKQPIISSIDMWSLGYVFHQLLFGKEPELRLPADENDHKNGRQVIFPNDAAVSEEAKEVIRGLLSDIPIQRLTWEQLFGHNLFKLNQNAQFIPNYSLNTDRPQVSVPRDVNEENLSPFEKVKKVNQMFHDCRMKATKAQFFRQVYASSKDKGKGKSKV